MTRASALRRASVLACAFALGCVTMLAVAPAGAQDAPWPRGAVTERVRAPGDTAEQFAVYLPSSYTTDRSWPVLFLLDAGGRALVPMSCFRAAAERHGWVVLSSWNTRAGAPSVIDADDRAMDAMLGAAQRSLRPDMRRLYVAGLSGTARLAWRYGTMLSANVAGVIGAAAGLPNSTLLLRYTGTKDPRAFPFGFYGTTGTADFNFDEVHALDVQLDRMEWPHHVAYFAGTHRWPSRELCAGAVDWMELLAMSRGLRPMQHSDSAWVDSLFTQRLATARADEHGGALFAAWTEYRSVATDFAALRDVSEARAKAASLADSKSVKATLSRLEKAADEMNDYLRTLTDAEAWVRDTPKTPSLRDALDKFQIPRLERDARKSDDSLTAQSALRRLARSVVDAAGGRQQALARGDAARARLYGELTREIVPVLQSLLHPAAAAPASAEPDSVRRR